ncbi:hypothetical protein Cni_G07943 [Canna indica]|uniref:Uncharacterized protein n=1 Tax=Canna indica TaxID=4628 RepID=A0AAQ3JZY8_9LILI|nr:hypothetical protein Cni_G07943 [Canna indica]
MTEKNQSSGDDDCDGDYDRPRSDSIPPKLKKPLDPSTKKISSGAVWRRKYEANARIRSSNLSSRASNNTSLNLKLGGQRIRYTIICDAAWIKDSGKAGLGFSILNESNEELMFGYGNAVAANALTAELKAIWMSLLRLKA